MNPSISKRDWTSDETLKLFEQQRVHASRWSAIAGEFDQRSPTFLKNTFFLTLRKVLRKLAKSSSRSISSADLKTLQPRILTEFLWSEFDLSALAPGHEPCVVRMIDIFKMVVLGDIAMFQNRFHQYARPLVDAIFSRLYRRKCP